MKKILILLFCLSLSSCTTPQEAFKSLIGNSTKDAEVYRKSALVKTFDCDRKTCYEKIKSTLKTMYKVYIYAEKDDMIAVFYVNLDTTPVGIFFTEVDPTHTKVEVSSPALDAKEWIAKNIFSGKPLEDTSEKLFYEPKQAKEMH